jgi:hypothetical protein
MIGAQLLFQELMSIGRTRHTPSYKTNVSIFLAPMLSMRLHHVSNHENLTYFLRNNQLNYRQLVLTVKCIRGDRFTVISKSSSQSVGCAAAA